MTVTGFELLGKFLQPPEGPRGESRLLIDHQLLQAKPAHLRRGLRAILHFAPEHLRHEESRRQRGASKQRHLFVAMLPLPDPPPTFENPPFHPPPGLAPP